MWQFKRKVAKIEEEAERTRNVTFPEDSFVGYKLNNIENQSDGDMPVIGSLNVSYIDFAHKDVFNWVLEIMVFVRQEEGGGFPSPEEQEVLDAMEDEITDLISPTHEQPNAIWILRETYGDARKIYFVVHDAEIADQLLKQLTDENSFGLPWQYSMKLENNWESLQWHFAEYLSSTSSNRLN